MTRSSESMPACFEASLQFLIRSVLDSFVTLWIFWDSFKSLIRRTFSIHAVFCDKQLLSGCIGNENTF